MFIYNHTAKVIIFKCSVSVNTDVITTTIIGATVPVEFFPSWKSLHVGWVQCKASASKDMTLKYGQAAIPQSGLGPFVLSVKRENKGNDERMTVWKEV